MTDKSRKRTACFTGHRPEKLPWKYNEDHPACRILKQVLADTLEALYADGFRHFLCGMASGADTYFGEAVVALRDEHSDITLEGVIPFQGQDKRWRADARQRYSRLAEECDSLTVLHSEYCSGCMMERNRYMVDRASLLIAVYDGRPGGTKNTIDYAFSQGLTIIQLPTSG